MSTGVAGGAPLLRSALTTRAALPALGSARVWKAHAQLSHLTRSRGRVRPLSQLSPVFWRSVRAARTPRGSRLKTPPLLFQVVAAMNALAHLAYADPLGPARASVAVGFNFGLPSHCTCGGLRRW